MIPHCLEGRELENFKLYVTRTSILTDPTHPLNLYFGHDVIKPQFRLFFEITAVISLKNLWQILNIQVIDPS